MYRNGFAAISVAALGFALQFSVPGPAFATETNVNKRSEFEAIVLGRELRAVGVRLEVLQDGAITGRAYGRRVTGFWTWSDGYFCRALELGGMKYVRDDCSAVTIDDRRITFIGNRGTGKAAWLTLY